MAAAAAVVVVEAGLLQPGLGIGWRSSLAESIGRLNGLSFVEVVAENLHDHGSGIDVPPDLQQLVDGGSTAVAHGISLSLGSAAEVDQSRLAHLRRVGEAIRAPLVSEHIAFVRAGSPAPPGAPHADMLEAGHLLPVPRSLDSLLVLTANIRQAVDGLEVPLALEPIAALAEWPDNTMTEGQFLTELLERTDALLVLDVANVYANAVNHGRDPLAALLEFPLERIAYCHIAGGSVMDGLYQDTHQDPVPREVLELGGELLQSTGPVPLMLERDGKFPPEAVFFAELDAIADAAGLPRVTPGATAGQLPE
ncbi:DUF692 domain-containing protein [Arthrobacter sp. CDRTa11]|uniref:DUF692 domain-containing protein n=1 Tax=Arthrobacter sp. CDRTa11 TaxID=2651199 RepID=UPI002265F3E6|nr:DUF692 domain-containing protein [Arthrobacter sp. CDRTa11]